MPERPKSQYLQTALDGASLDRNTIKGTPVISRGGSEL